MPGDEMRKLAAENAALQNRLAELERERAIRRGLDGVLAAEAGERGIARALHSITGLPAAIEDRFGNLRAWAGPGRPDPYPKAGTKQREEFLRDVTRRGPVARVNDRLVVLARTRDGGMLGVLALVDPGRGAGRHEAAALGYGALVLTGELARQRGLAELERRLRGDLVTDLVNGSSARPGFRSRAIDHDLHEPHHVVVIRWTGSRRWLTCAVEHAAASLGTPGLVSTMDGQAVLLAADRPDGAALHGAIARRVRTAAGAIGIGGQCERPEEIPRSFREATLALEIRLCSDDPHGATAFDELGVVRLLDTADGGAKIRRFVRDWLGPLLDYDTRNRTRLVPTLARHLDCGGNYDEAAGALLIHRSTLRYRLQRIREVGGFDLADADHRLQLHVATRAWRMLGGRA
jgi:hypothetical protein